MPWNLIMLITAQLLMLNWVTQNEVRGQDHIIENKSNSENLNSEELRKIYINLMEDEKEQTTLILVQFTAGIKKKTDVFCTERSIQIIINFLWIFSVLKLQPLARKLEPKKEEQVVIRFSRSLLKNQLPTWHWRIFSRIKTYGLAIVGW